MDHISGLRRTSSWFWRGLVFLLKLMFVLVRWPGLVIGLFVLAGLVIYGLGGQLDRLVPGSRERALAEAGVRLLTAVPLAGVAVLLLHPLRGPLMLWSLPGRLLRRVRSRGAATAGQVHPAPAGEHADEEAARLYVPDLPKPQQLRYRRLSRRRFLIESAAVSAILADALLVEPNWVEFTTVEIRVPRLPERFRDFRIAQISDLHLSPFINVADLEWLVPQVNALRADMVVFTGDLVDQDWRYAAPGVEVLRGLRAPEGVFSVLGNHDHYADVDRVSSALRGGDLGLLVNTHTVLRRGADRLYLLGVDDATPSRRYSGFRPFADLPRAMQGVVRDAPSLLLLHNPVLAPAVVEAGIDLTLCGHTHAGQFRVPYLTDAIVRNVEYIEFGRYQWGNSQFYVNRGFGTVGPPLRFRARPEISLIRLLPA